MSKSIKEVNKSFSISSDEKENPFSPSSPNNSHLLNRKISRNSHKSNPIESPSLEIQKNINGISGTLDARCSICLEYDRYILNGEKCIFCKKCKSNFHKSCLLKENEDNELIIDDENNYICQRCQEEEKNPNILKKCFLCFQHDGILKPFYDKDNKDNNEIQFVHYYCLNFKENINKDNKNNLKKDKPKICKICSKDENFAPLVKCEKKSCRNKYHLHCALEKGYIMSMKYLKDYYKNKNVNISDKYPFYCEKHNEDIIKAHEEKIISLINLVGNKTDNNDTTIKNQNSNKKRGVKNKTIREGCNNKEGKDSKSKKNKKLKTSEVEDNESKNNDIHISEKINNSLISEKNLNQGRDGDMRKVEIERTFSGCENNDDMIATDNNNINNIIINEDPHINNIHNNNNNNRSIQQNNQSSFNSNNLSSNNNSKNSIKEKDKEKDTQKDIEKEVSKEKDKFSNSHSHLDSHPNNDDNNSINNIITNKNEINNIEKPKIINLENNNNNKINNSISNSNISSYEIKSSPPKNEDLNFIASKANDENKKDLKKNESENNCILKGFGTGDDEEEDEIMKSQTNKENDREKEILDNSNKNEINSCVKDENMIIDNNNNDNQIVQEKRNLFENFRKLNEGYTFPGAFYRYHNLIFPVH